MRLLKKLWPFGTPAPAKTGEIGAAHEKAAAAWLVEQGYAIEALNFRIRLGEVDIIASRGPVIAFVEVRYRSSAAYGLPQETVTLPKQRRIAKAALSYVKMKKIAGKDLRFDVIAIGSSGVIEHIPSAFVPGGYWY